MLDLLRIVFALFVLLAHAVELTDGNRSRELFANLTGTPMSLGDIGVDGFFLLSGYLIVRSWQGDPELLNYLKKRLLRIVPGYMVAVLLSVVAVGWLAPAAPHFFSHLRGRFVASVLTLNYPFTPTTLPGMSATGVNGSLWTIAYEFRCYLVVALAGLCGFLKRPAAWLTATAGFLVAMTFFGGRVFAAETFHSTMLMGRPGSSFRLTAIFLVGGCYFLFRERIVFRPGIAVLSVAAILANIVLYPEHIETVLVLSGSYVMFYFAQSATAARIRIKGLPDISYGLYLYGWPVEALWIWFHHGSLWVTFAASTLICTVLAWLSWHFVERPMLGLKRRPTAALPAG